MKVRIFVLARLLWLSLPIMAQSISGKGDMILLWPSSMPDGPGPEGMMRTGKNNSLRNISQPMLIVHRPDHPNGTAILVISGGGYAHIEEGKESGPASNWLASQGVTAFELVYRLPREGWASVNVPFEDGQRAMRIIRSRAKEFGIDTQKIGVIGFSAGGHLAGMLTTRFDKQWYSPVDKVDTCTARPDFAVLLYPVITMMPPYNNTHAYKEILGSGATRKQQQLYSVESHVTKNTPPVFLAQAKDDPISPIQNSELLYHALKQHKIQSEIHIFPSGGHGWGMGLPGTTVSVWPLLFRNWAKKSSLM